MLKLVNGLFAELPSIGIVLNNSIFRPWTQVGMSMTKSDEYNEDWMERTKTGFIPSIIIVGAIIILALFSTIYTYLKMKNYKINLL